VVAVAGTVDVPLSSVLGPAPRHPDKPKKKHRRRDVSLVVICAQVRDPGNAGTVIRCADAFGADAVILSTDAEQMRRHAGSFDFILDTISAEHDIDAYIQMLGLDGRLTLVGAPVEPLQVSAFGLLFGRKSLSGSLIGGIEETQELLDFCGRHEIAADVEVIPIQRVNEAYERLLKSDVKYRFSIDMKSLKTERG